MMRRFVCCECQTEFDEDAEASYVDYEDGLQLIEQFCPACGTDDIEDIENLTAVREMKRSLS